MPAEQNKEKITARTTEEYVCEIVRITVRLLIARHGRELVLSELEEILIGNARRASLTSSQAFEAMLHAAENPGQLGAWTWCAMETPKAPDGFDNISVLGVIDDPQLRANGDEPFVDIVAYWPQKKIWTVTHQCRADDPRHGQGVHDFSCRVVKWQPLPEV